MAKKLELARPETAEQALALLGSGSSYAEISRVTGLNYRTIARLASDNQETVEKWRVEAGKKAREVASVLLERIYSKASDPNEALGLKDLSVTYGIVSDKSLLLQGEATQIAEQRTGMDISQAREAIEQARQRISAEVVEV